MRVLIVLHPSKNLALPVFCFISSDRHVFVSFSCLICCLMKLNILKNKTLLVIGVSSFVKYLLNSFPAFLLSYLIFFSTIPRSFNIFWTSLSYDTYIANISYPYGLSFHYISGVFYFYLFFNTQLDSLPPSPPF